mmetsp:Transcript_26084/g.67631  ORF Transcript_26084/g.67631 Transcript_26084/m.67631 type:complete len:107 (-) Transcript_26084:38-358(-)
MRATVALLGALAASTALVAPTRHLRTLRRPRAADGDTEVFEALDDDDDDAAAAPAPATDEFTPDEDDPTQQTRVLAYMGLSLLPIIGLVPFFAGRDFVPADPSLYS